MLLKKIEQTPHVADTPPGRILDLIRWLIVLTVATGLCVLGYALVRPETRTDQSYPTASPTPAPISPMPSDLPSGQVTTVPSGETLAPTSLSPEATSTPVNTEIEAMIAGMSLPDKVAQMVMVGFHGQTLATSPELTTMIGAYHVGGVVLLEANAHDPWQLSALTAELQSLATSSGAGIPVFISINHEGGIVVRITEGVTEFPGNMAVGATERMEFAYIAAALAAQELRAMGVNMNLAPVLDVNDNPLNPIIGTRSFGESPALVAQYGQLTVRGSQDYGVVAVAKHFPGHGSVAVDSHGALPVLQTSVDQLMQHELVPFQAAIDEGVAGIMTAHIAIPALDGSGRPATLSPQILTALLRQQMGYDGLLLTDSLGMGGITANWGQAQAAVQAVQAGADIVLSTTPMEAHIAIIQALITAVQQGEISTERIDESIRRILHVKYAYGLFDSSTAALDLSGVGSPEHQARANEIALQAVTLLRDDVDNIPLPLPPARLLLVSPNQLPPAASGDGSTFAQLLRERGYQITELTFNLDSGESRDYVYANALAQAAAHDVVIFGEWELVKRYINWDDRWQEELVETLRQSTFSLIVVAWHNPAAIQRCAQAPTFLTAYGNTRAQVAAVVAALTGEQPPLGHLPITLPEVISDQ